MSVVIAGEKVYLDTTTTGIGIVNLANYNVNETVKHLFKSTVPTFYDKCEIDVLTRFLNGLKYRLKIIEGERDTLLKTRGATTTARALLDHAQRLTDYIEKVKKAIEVTCKNPVGPSEALPISLPMQFTEEKIQELVRKFAVLILHAREPKPVDSALDRPAFNVLTKIDSIKNLTPEFEVAHTNPYPILHDLISLAKLGHTAFLDELFKELLAKIKPISQPFSDGLDTTKSSSDQIIQLIKRLLSEKDKMQIELRKVNTQADEIQAQLERAEKELADKPDYDSMKADRDRLHAELINVTGQKEKLRTDFDAMEDIMNKARIAADESAAKAAGRIAELESELKASYETVSNLEADILRNEDVSAKERGERLTLQKEVERLTTECAQLKAAQGDKKVIDARLAKLQDSLAKAQEHLETSEKRHSETEDAIRTLDAKLRAKIAEEQAKYARLTTEHEGLTKALQDAKAAYDIVAGERDTALREGKEVAAAATQMFEAEHQKLLAAQKSLEEDKVELANLVKQKENLMNELTSSKAREGKLAGVSETDKEALSAAEARLAELTPKLAAAEASVLAKGAEVARTSSELASLREQFASLQKTAEATKTNLEMQLATLRETSSTSIEKLERSCKERIDAALRDANEKFKDELQKHNSASAEQQKSISKRLSITAEQFKTELQGFEAAIHQKNEEIARIIAARDADIRRVREAADAEKAAIRSDFEKKAGEVRDKASLDIDAALAAANAACARRIAEITEKTKTDCEKAIQDAVFEETKKGQQALGTAVQQATERGRAALEQGIQEEKARSKAAIEEIEKKLLNLNEEKQKAIADAVADVSMQKEAEFSKRLAKLSGEDASKLAELTKQKDMEKDAAVAAAKKDVAQGYEIAKQRLIAQKDGELAAAAQAAAASAQVAAQAAVKATTAEFQTKAEQAAIAADAHEKASIAQVQATSLAKLKDFAARVLAGHASMNDYKGPNDEPLRSILRKIESMKAKDICILAYFVHYFMTHIRIPRDIEAQLVGFVNAIPDLFGFIIATLPSLILGNKIQSLQPMRYFVPQSSEELNNIAQLSRLVIDTRVIAKMVRGEGAPTLAFYPESTKSRMLLIANDGPLDAMKKYSDGILTNAQPQDKTNPPQMLLPISYDVIFLAFLFATRNYVKRTLTEKPELCTVLPSVLDDKAPLPKAAPPLCVPANIRVLEKGSQINVIQLHPDHIALFNEDPFCFRVDGQRMDPLLHAKVKLNYRDIEEALKGVVERFCSGKNPVPLKIPPGFYQHPEKNMILPIQERGKDSSTVFDITGYGGQAQKNYICSSKQLQARRPSSATEVKTPFMQPGSLRLAKQYDNGTHIENIEGGRIKTKKNKKNKHTSKKFTQRKR